MAHRRCSIAECSRNTRTKSAAWCNTHYQRYRRHGDPNKHVPSSKITVRTASEYRWITKHGHPVAWPNGRAYEHRVVLYDAIGGGPHACHWCGTTVRWTNDGQHAPDRLTVDHLDGVKNNNDLGNLVPACGPCNVARTRRLYAAEVRRQGYCHRVKSNDQVA